MLVLPWHVTWQRIRISMLGVADISDDILGKFKTDTKIQTVKHDLSDRQSLKTVIADFDMVINAVCVKFILEMLKLKNIVYRPTITDL